MANISFSVFVVTLLALQAATVLAAKAAKVAKAAKAPDCSMYNFKLISLAVCDGVDSVISVKDFNVTLNADCTIVPTGCITRKAYKTAMVTYDINKGGIRMKGEVDACKEADNMSAATKALIGPIKAYATCPADAAELCGDKNAAVSVADFINYLRFALGNVSGKVNIAHDTGSTCVNFKAKLTKKPAPKKVKSTTPKA